MPHGSPTRKPVALSLIDFKAVLLTDERGISTTFHFPVVTKPIGADTNELTMQIIENDGTGKGEFSFSENFLIRF